MEEQTKVEQWAVVELFGHQKIAGLLTEATIGGCSFVRVDVPANGTSAAFTKLYGNGAIYAISFVSEEIARRASTYFEIKPIQSYELARLDMAAQGASVDENDFDPETAY